MDNTAATEEVTDGVSEEVTGGLTGYQKKIIWVGVGVLALAGLVGVGYIVLRTKTQSSDEATSVSSS